MTTEQQHIPKLRFPGFSEGWEKNYLEEVSTVTSGGTPSRSNVSYWNGDIPWVSTAQVDFNVITFTNESISQQGLENSSAKLFPKETVLIAMYGQGKTRGKSAILGIDASTNQACAAILPAENFSSQYLFQYLSRSYEDLRSLSNEGGQKNLSGRLIKNLKIPFPCIYEQQKIANFLTSIDTRIQQLTQKKALLEQYKKGMMQKLFSQEIRFKDDDGKDYPDWEEKKLGDVAQRVTNKNKGSVVDRVLTNSATLGIIDQADYFDHDIANAENLGNYYVVEVGDFVYNPRTSSSAPVGPIKRNDRSLGVMSPLYDVFRFNTDNTDFWKQYFFSSQWYRYMKQVANYGARHDRMAISTSDFMRMPILNPCISEQQKIANLLSVIDERIETVVSKLAQAQIYKKGLLQQMFV